MPSDTERPLTELRRLAALVVTTEGCGCCEERDHEKHKTALARALRIAKYKDGSGYDWHRYAKERP